MGSHFSTVPPLNSPPPSIRTKFIHTSKPLLTNTSKDWIIKQAVQIGNKRSNQIGFQLYAHLIDKEEESLKQENALPWERFDVTFSFDYHSLGRIFSEITDHLWPTDTVHLYRMSLLSVINPTPITISCLIQGLNWTKDECFKGIILRLPPYRNGVMDHPVFEESVEKEKTQCRFEEIDVEIIWSLNDSTPQQLIQWMLEEEKPIVCFSVMLDLIYCVESHEKK